MKVYHGSHNLFPRPDFSLIENRSGLGTNEYGFGFYGADHGEDAWERISSGIAQGKPSFIYTMDIPDERFERNWLKTGVPVGGDIIARVAGTLDDMGMTETAARIRDTDPGIDGSSFYESLHVGKTARDHSNFWHKAGVEGRLAGSYFVFFHEDSVPKLTIDQTYNYKRDAASDLAALQAGSKPPSDPEVFARLDKTNFMSEEAGKAYYALKHKTGDAELAALYVDIIETSKDAPPQHNRGFDVRNALGHAVQRSFMTDPYYHEHAYFGTTLLNLRDGVRDSFLGNNPDALAKVDKFVERLSDQPQVALYLAQAPFGGQRVRNKDLSR